MAQIRKAEGQVEIKAHAHRFFDVWVRKPHQLTKICSDKIVKMELQEGDWGKIGCVNTWHFVNNGKIEYLKTKVAEIDENNKSMSYNYLDGQVLNYYSSNLRSRMQIIPKGKTCIVKWTIDYEKMNEDAPDADVYVDYLLNCAKDTETHLCSA